MSQQDISPLAIAFAWQPIETAPKDGTTILLFCPKGNGNPGSTYRVTVGDWYEDYGGTIEHRDANGNWIGQDDRDGFVGWNSWDGGFSEDTMMPTHWMPLPPPPAAIASMKTKVTEGDEFYQWAINAIGSLAFHNQAEAQKLADKLRLLLSSTSNVIENDRNLLLREGGYPNGKEDV